MAAAPDIDPEPGEPNHTHARTCENTRPCQIVRILGSLPICLRPPPRTLKNLHARLHAHTQTRSSSSQLPRRPTHTTMTSMGVGVGVGVGVGAGPRWGMARVRAPGGGLQLWERPHVKISVHCARAHTHPPTHPHTHSCTQPHTHVCTTTP